MSADAARVVPMREPVKCPTCTEVVFTGSVVLTRCLRVGERRTEAKCKRCKTWVEVPLVYRR